MMADHHKGYAVPIGGVVAYEDRISPSGVGYDIACGNKAVLTDAPAADIKAHIGKIMDDVFSNIAFGVGRKNDTRVDHELFDDVAWSCKAVAPLKEMARQQLGTVGSGNHYVDIFEDERGRIWVGVHFGSRGLGHKTATHFLRAAGAVDAMDAEPCILQTGTAIGDDYLTCMELAGKYAYAGRDWVCAEVARLLGANILEEVHNHHNFAWRETHGGRDLWVVRKGATPAFPGQKGFVGGSMGDRSVILEGMESPDGAPSLYSTVHGAGRVMSRTEAAGKFQKGGEWGCGQRDCNGRLPSATERSEDGSNPRCPLCGSRMHKRRGPGERTRVGGKVTHDMMRDWVQREGVTLRGAGCDESPHCYKRLPDVLKHHEASVRILHTLTPLGVAMAGENEFDPYKD